MEGTLEVLRALREGLGWPLGAGAEGPREEARPTALPLPLAVALAVLAACGGFALSYQSLSTRGGLAADFTWALRGVERLLAGDNPYNDPGLAPYHPYPFDAPLFYPLPALLVALPFTPLPYELAGALFFGVSSGLLAFGLARRAPFLLPLFLSAPYYVAATVAQWSPLVTAAAFIPALLPLTLCKPNVGLPVLIHRGTVKGLPLLAAVALLSLAVMPNWPIEWFSNLRLAGPQYRMPLAVIPGPILLLALLLWRRADGRLFLLLCALPQRLWFYDQLPVWLVVRSWGESLTLTASSWIGYTLWRLLPDGDTRAGTSPETAGPWVVLAIYLPALALLLLREVHRIQAASDQAARPVVEHEVARARPNERLERRRSVE